MKTCLPVLAMLVIPLLGACTSASEPPATTGSSKDAGKDAALDAVDAAPGVTLRPPVQVEVTTKSPPNVDCGPGCRVLLGPIDHSDGFSFTETVDYAVDTNSNELMIRRFDSNEIMVIAQRSAQAYAEGNRIAFTFVNEFPLLDMMVLDTTTWHLQSYFHTSKGDEYGPTANLLTDKYFLWAHGGRTTRANLATGEMVDFSGVLYCDRGCFGAGAIYCLLGSVERINPETFERTKISGDALDVDAACSPDRKRIAWVDFRDPPGHTSSHYGARIGGEIYVHEFETGETKRLTFDSPANPIAKSTVGVGSDVVVWLEPCASCPKSFESAQEYFAEANTIVRLDIPSGKKCRYERERTGGYFSVHGHHLHAYWSGPLTPQYLIDIDMDDPGIPWVCE